MYCRFLVRLSMKKNLYIETKLDKELCYATAKHIIWRNSIFIVFLCIGIALTLTVPIFVICGYTMPNAFLANVGFLPGFILTIIILYAPHYIGKNMYKKDGDKIIKFTFIDNQIDIKNDKEIIHLTYDKIKKYNVSDKYIFIFSKGPDSIVYVISKNKITNISPEAFISYLQQKIAK